MSRISIATNKDIAILEALINSAYRGEASKKGWTTEADILSGEIRTDAGDITRQMNKPGACFLKCNDDEGVIQGTVYLEKNNNRLYLGMLSVSPTRQAHGIGKELLHAAEQHAKKSGCEVIYMTVISVREELIAWYSRQGYLDSGKRIPFNGEARFGKPKIPLEFLVLEKKIK
ncbi:MAG: GNAT family N-acetyltransferase [Chitinophagales bacterium]